MAIFLPLIFPNFSLIEYASNNACVGCSCAPSPALIILASTCFARNAAAPGLGWRITTISTFIAKILFTVSINVSPFLTEDKEDEKFITSALRRFSANSNDNFVRVEFSKNKLAMVISRNEGTFFIGRLMTSLKFSAVLKIKLISSAVISFIPNKCLVLSFVIFFYFSIFSFYHFLIHTPNNVTLSAPSISFQSTFTFSDA